MARALAPTSMLCPARHRQRRDGVGSISLSVRRPGLAPHRRSCILLAAAWLLSLRTRHTALCYVPFNEGSRDVTGAMWWWRNHSPTRQLSCRQSLMSTRSVQALAPTSPSLVGVFLFQPCSAGIDGGTISSYAGCSYASTGISRAHDPGSPVSSSWRGSLLFQAAAPAMGSAAMPPGSRASAGLVGDCWITASIGQARGSGLGRIAG
jgi:hypothetical protein